MLILTSPSSPSLSFYLGFRWWNGEFAYHDGCCRGRHGCSCSVWIVSFASTPWWTQCSQCKGVGGMYIDRQAKQNDLVDQVKPWIGSSVSTPDPPKDHCGQKCGISREILKEGQLVARRRGCFWVRLAPLFTSRIGDFFPGWWKSLWWPESKNPTDSPPSWFLWVWFLSHVLSQV